MNTKNNHYAEKRASASDLYDFSGPLWEKYHEETRKKVRFPRGYKEVRLF